MSTDMAADWKRFADLARAGELYLDSEAVAKKCYDACEQRITDLEDLLRQAQYTQRVSGFGDFEMGRMLQGKFLKQAVGTDNSIDAVILKHIEIVKDMREVMALSFKTITGQDITTATEFTNTTESLGG